jgi:hypothetical protein
VIFALVVIVLMRTHPGGLSALAAVLAGRLRNGRHFGALRH